MEKFLYPKHPTRCINSGPSKCSKSHFPTNKILKYINEFEKLFIYTASLHQDLNR